MFVSDSVTINEMLFKWSSSRNKLCPGQGVTVGSWCKQNLNIYLMLTLNLAFISTIFEQFI